MPELALDQIKTREGFNPRADFDDAEHNALVKSIKARGLLQPLVVTPNDSGYYLVGGERRLRALIEAGFTSAPVVIRHEGAIGEAYDQTEQLIDAITENTVRADLTPVEEAQAFARLKAGGRSVRQIAAELAVTEKLVRERLKLLELPAFVQVAISTGQLTTGYAPTLVEIAKVSQNLACGLTTRIIERQITASAFAANPLAGCSTAMPDLDIWFTHGYVDARTNELDYSPWPWTDKAKDALRETAQLSGSSYLSVDLDEQDVAAGVQYGAIYKPEGDDFPQTYAICDRAWLSDLLERKAKNRLRAARKHARENAPEGGA